MIPTYNRDEHVRCAIESALSQTHPCDEIIVVDDGSTDKTPGTLAAYAERIRVLRQENRGVAVARNVGIRAAESEWIAFLDSDDEMEPTRLQRFGEDLARWPDIVAHCGNALFCQGDQMSHDQLSLRGLQAGDASHFVARPLELHIQMQFMTSTFTVRRDVLLAETGFPSHVRIFEDYHLMTRVALRGPWAWTERTLAKMFRRGPESSNTFLHLPDQALQMGLSLADTYRTLLARDELQRKERQLVGSRFSSSLADVADAYRVEGKIGNALAQYGRSLQAQLSIHTLVRALVGFSAGPGALAWLRRRRSRSS